MPPKKRKSQLKCARAVKQQKLLENAGNQNTTPTSAALIIVPDQEDVIPTFSDYESDEDSTYNPLTEDLDEEVAIHQHACEWVESLHCDDIMSLMIFLHHLLVNRMHILSTNAAKLIGEMIGKSDCTVPEWRGTFLANENTFPHSLQGKYERQGVLWHNEELN